MKKTVYICDLCKYQYDTVDNMLGYMAPPQGETGIRPLEIVDGHVQTAHTIHICPECSEIVHEDYTTHVEPNLDEGV